jgi:CubicO group peptidase (beta-lactamase class C family)
MRRTFVPHLILLACLAFFINASHAQQAGIDAVLASFDQDAHADLRSVLVLRDGRVVAERYYNGELPETLHDVRSAGKSITALLVGAAIDRGLIHGVTDPVGAYWTAAKGSAIGDVPLASVLTMRSGLAAFDSDTASPGNEDRMDDAVDPIAFMLAVPRADPPGTRYRYNSLTAHVAGLTVEYASGRNLEGFARSALFAPLDIAQWSWGRDAAGHPKGQGNLSLRTRDLAKIGQLVLDRGRYQGRRVISEAWIAAMLAPRVHITDVDRYADDYGYFWYAKLLSLEETKAGAKSVPVSFASGNGGNKIYVLPTLHTVVVITSSAYGKAYGQQRSETILKAILAEGFGPD